MKDHMQISLSQVLKSKNSREDSREDSREKYLKAELYFTNWLKLSIPSIPCSPPDIYRRIHQDPNYIATGIDYASNKGDKGDIYAS